MALIDVGRPTFDEADQPPPFTSPFPGPAPRRPTAPAYNPLQGAQQAIGAAWMPSVDTGYPPLATRRGEDEGGGERGGGGGTTGGGATGDGGVGGAVPRDWTSHPGYQQLAAAYRQYLGREGSPQEILGQVGGGSQLGRPDWQQRVQYSINQIRNSPEAQAYARRPPTPTGGGTTGGGGPEWWTYGGNYQRYFQDLIAGKPPTPATLAALEGPLSQAGIKVLRNAAGVAGKIQLPTGQIIDVIQGANVGGQAWQWLTGDQGGGVPTPTGGGTSYQGTGTFDDPATKALEDLLNQRIAAMFQPYQNPDFNNLLSYLRQYMTSLQGAPYTPAQTNLIQTQFADPVERQRQMQKQATLQRLASRGIDPTSGIAEQALENVDRQFDTLRTQGEAQFAQQSISRADERAQQAAAVGNALAQLQYQQFLDQQARENQALGFAQIIPNLAWQRTQGAGAFANQGAIDPLAALSSMNAFQQQGYNQQQQWLQILMGLIGNLFPRSA